MFQAIFRVQSFGKCSAKGVFIAFLKKVSSFS